MKKDSVGQDVQFENFPSLNSRNLYILPNTIKKIL